MDIRNPIFTNDNRIDCEIAHPIYGWIPFTADPDDIEQHGREIYAAALSMGPSAYVTSPPMPTPIPQSISFAQLLIGLVSEGWITPEEGRAWRDRVSLPLPVLELIATLPVEQQFAAETKAFAPSEIIRLDPMVVQLGSSQGKTETELDTFFSTYSLV